MVMNPPSTGDNLGVPGSTVANSHGAGLCQGARGDGVSCRGGGRKQKCVETSSLKTGIRQNKGST